MFIKFIQASITNPIIGDKITDNLADAPLQPPAFTKGQQAP